MDARQVRIDSDGVTKDELDRLTEQQYDRWLELAGTLQYGDGLPEIDADRRAYKVVTQGSAADAK